MEKTRIVSHKPVHGEVEANDGEFAEIQTAGIEGIEKELKRTLPLETLQVHRPERYELFMRTVSGQVPCWIMAGHLYNHRGEVDYE